MYYEESLVIVCKVANRSLTHRIAEPLKHLLLYSQEGGIRGERGLEGSWCLEAQTSRLVSLDHHCEMMFAEHSELVLN